MKEGSELDSFDIEDLDLEWLALTEGAAEDFNDEDHASAFERWRQAADFVDGLPAKDPRRACTLSNLGVVQYLNEERELARVSFEAALLAWDAAGEWVDGMALEPRARSSLFHMRMELQHRERYQRPVKDRYRRTLQRGRAATLSNLAACLVAEGLRDDGLSAYSDAAAAAEQAGEDGEGIARAIEIALSLAGANGAAPQDALLYDEFASQAGEQCWLVDLPPVMTDEGRLMAAVRLAGALADGASANW